MKIATYFSLVLMTFFISSCANKYNEEEIRANAQGYLQAVGDYQFDEAIPYASQHTREYTIPTFKMLLEHSNMEYINSNRPSVFTYYNVRRINDTAACIYYHKHTPIKEVDDSLTLIYEDGHWLADVHLGPIPYVSGPKTSASDSMPPLPKITKDMKPIPVDSLKATRLGNAPNAPQRSR